MHERWLQFTYKQNNYGHLSVCDQFDLFGKQYGMTMFWTLIHICFKNDRLNLYHWRYIKID